MNLNIEHQIFVNGELTDLVIPDCIPILNEDDTINNVGLIHFLKATKSLDSISKPYDYFIGDKVQCHKYSEYGDINIKKINIDNTLDCQLVAKIRFLD